MQDLNVTTPISRTYSPHLRHLTMVISMALVKEIEDYANRFNMLNILESDGSLAPYLTYRLSCVLETTLLERLPDMAALYGTIKQQESRASEDPYTIGKAVTLSRLWPLLSSMDNPS